jgi:hypothetical protein
MLQSVTHPARGRANVAARAVWRVRAVEDEENPASTRVLRRWGGVFDLVELRGIEPRTFSLRTRRATNCATAPWCA